MWYMPIHENYSQQRCVATIINSLSILFSGDSDSLQLCVCVCCIFHPIEDLLKSCFFYWFSVDPANLLHGVGLAQTNEPLGWWCGFLTQSHSMFHSPVRHTSNKPFHFPNYVKVSANPTVDTMLTIMFGLAKLMWKNKFHDGRETLESTYVSTLWQTATSF